MLKMISSALCWSSCLNTASARLMMISTGIMITPIIMSSLMSFSDLLCSRLCWWWFTIISCFSVARKMLSCIRELPSIRSTEPITETWRLVTDWSGWVIDWLPGKWNNLKTVSCSLYMRREKLSRFLISTTSSVSWTVVSAQDLKLRGLMKGLRIWIPLRRWSERSLHVAEAELSQNAGLISCVN